MSSVYSVIDAAQYGLSVENVKAYVASQNIANVNTPGYIAKTVDANELYSPDGSQSFQDLLGEAGDLSSQIKEAPGKKISLDTEVVAASDAGLRYQVIAQIIQKKFGMLDLVYGAKR